MNTANNLKHFLKRRSASFTVDYLAAPETDRRLKYYLGISSERELLNYLGCDYYYLSCRDISQNESLKTIYKGPHLYLKEDKRTCPFGISWTRGAFQSKFAVDEAIENPLSDANSEKDILNYNWPKVDWFDFDTLHGEIEENYDKTIIGGFWAGILGDSYRMYGFEKFLLDMTLKPDVIKTLINRMTDFYLELNSKLFDQLGDKINICFFGNDLGSQSGLLFSPQMLDEFFMNNFKKLCDLAHSHNINVMMHSCGAISEIIPMLIEAGVDILDPIQVTAKEMEPENLEKKFGDKLIFHGGIDTQQILPKGTPVQVKQHCIETIEAFGADGGYIFSPSQILSSDIPSENIDAMYSVAKDYKKRFQS